MYFFKCFLDFNPLASANGLNAEVTEQLLFFVFSCQFNWGT